MEVVLDIKDYFLNFTNQEPFNNIPEYDEENENFDYHFSYLVFIYDFISSLKGYGLCNDIDKKVFKRLKLIYDTHIDTYCDDLQIANSIRQIEWDTDSQIGALFRAVEFGGEMGEVLNVVKKLERERMGINGSRDTLEHLAEEIADSFISLTLLAQHYNIDVDKAIAEKFNKTSTANGLKTKMLIPL